MFAKKHASHSCDCLVIGDVLWDIIIEDVPKKLMLGGTAYTNNALLSAGGSGNVAVGIATLGGKAAFIGKAGKDFLGKQYKKDLLANNVKERVSYDKRVGTGFTVTFLNGDKQRSFIIFRGANDNLTPSEIESQTELLENATFLYISGYSLVREPQLKAVLWAVDAAEELGKKIIFDPGAHNLINSKRKLFVSLMERCHVFSPNLEEAKAITNSERITDIITELKKLHIDMIALKLGSKGSVLISPEATQRTPAVASKCIDSTGAGDAFVAATIYGLTHKLSLKSIGELANSYAGEVVSSFGARIAVSRSKIHQFLSMQSLEMEEE